MRSKKNQQNQKKFLKYCRPLLQAALAEDVGCGDITSQSVCNPSLVISGRIIAQEQGCVCGTILVKELARLLDRRVSVQIKKRDGSMVIAGDTVLVCRGKARSLFILERVALNILGKLSGIASLTARFVAVVKKYGIDILDTRKTTPLLRMFERYAVRCGGGVNHRFGLFDQVLIKDNHIAAWKKNAGASKSLADMIRVVRRKIPAGMALEIEVDTLAQLEDVLPGGPDIILLDNMTPRQLREGVAIVSVYSKAYQMQRPILEASGGVTLKTIARIAQTGIDRISIGALTHSAPQLNFSLEIID